MSDIYDQVENLQGGNDIYSKVETESSKPQKETPNDIYSLIESEQDALNAGADSKTLAYAKSKLGSHDYKMLCQRLVNQATGSQYGSAIQAWNSQKGVPGMLGAKPGDLVYFGATPSNKYYGHGGVYEGNNKIIAGGTNKVGEFDINDWSKSTGQPLLGYIPE